MSKTCGSCRYIKEAPYMKSFLLICPHLGKLIDSKEVLACDSHWDSGNGDGK